MALSFLAVERQEQPSQPSRSITPHTAHLVGEQPIPLVLLGSRAVHPLEGGVLDEDRQGSQDEGCKEVQVDVVPGAVQVPEGKRGPLSLATAATLLRYPFPTRRACLQRGGLCSVPPSSVGVHLPHNLGDPGPAQVLPLQEASSGAVTPSVLSLWHGTLFYGLA